MWRAAGLGSDALVYIDIAVRSLIPALSDTFVLSGTLDIITGYSRYPDTATAQLPKGTRRNLNQIQRTVCEKQWLVRTLSQESH